MKLRITAVCDKGCIRENNEDMLLVGKKILRDDRLQGSIDLADSDLYILAVADGMGGHNAGEVASQMALEHLREELYSIDTTIKEDELSILIREICNNCHNAINSIGKNDFRKKGMGTTLTALFHYNGSLYYIHAGDSRLYRLRNGLLMQISQDHSLKAATV